MGYGVVGLQQHLGAGLVLRLAYLDLPLGLFEGGWLFDPSCQNLMSLEVVFLEHLAAIGEGVDESPPVGDDHGGDGGFVAAFLNGWGGTMQVYLLVDYWVI